MRYIISQTIITNRIPVADDDVRSDAALEEDFTNDPASFARDDNPTVEADIFVAVEDDA